MTEDEAKTKRCPLIAGIKIESGAVQIGGATCIGSDCMMWRWSLSGKNASETATAVIFIDTDKGYCGLAGKP